VMSSTVATFSAATLPVLNPITTPPPPTIQPLTTPPLQPGGDSTFKSTVITTQSTPPQGTPPVTLPPVNPPPVTPPPVNPPPPPIKASGILLFGDANLVPISGPGFRTQLESDLRTAQPNVLLTNLNSPSLPADLSAYGTIWHVGAFNAISATDQTRLAQFLASGGGPYLTRRRPGFQPPHKSIQSLLRMVVVGGDAIVVGSRRDFPPVGNPLVFPEAVFNPTARGGIATMPNTLTSWVPNGPGELFGIAGANVLATIGDGIVSGVWSEADLMGNAGRIVLMMDINWLSDPFTVKQCDDACRQAIIANFITFLDDPAGPIVLNGPLFRSVNETFSTWSSFFDLPNVSLVNTSIDPLFSFTGSTFTTRGVFS